MYYFEYLPKSFYNLSNTSAVNVVTNITNRVQFNELLKNNSVSYYEYIVNDGETPEMIADKIYKNSNRHWIILLINDIVDPKKDWPLDGKALNSYIEVKYAEMANTTPVINWAKTNVKTYYKVEKRTNTTTGSAKLEIIEVDQQTYSNIANSQIVVTTQDNESIDLYVDKLSLTYYDYEYQVNENKRKIKLLKPEYIEMVEREMEGMYS